LYHQETLHDSKKFRGYDTVRVLLIGSGFRYDTCLVDGPYLAENKISYRIDLAKALQTVYCPEILICV